MKKLPVVIFIIAALLTVTITSDASSPTVPVMSDDAADLISMMKQGVQEGGANAVDSFNTEVHRISSDDDLVFYTETGESETDAGLCRWCSLKYGCVTYSSAQSPDELTCTVGVENREEGYTYAYSISYKYSTGTCTGYESIHFLDGRVERLIAAE